MVFHKKIDRAMNWVKDKNKDDELINHRCYEEDAEKDGCSSDRRDLKKPVLDMELDKKDVPAMILSALMILIPAALLVLFVMVFIAFLFFH